MVREQRVESFYDRLRRSLQSSSECPLIVLPSTSDVDSLCALQIIEHMFGLDVVRYACYPVSSLQEVQKHVSSYMDSTSGSVPVLLVNWGSDRDLKRVFNFDERVQVFVVDSHRPIHLSNLREDNENVVILYTRDDEQQADLACDFDITALADASALVGEDDDDYASQSEQDSESDGENGDRVSERKRRRVSEKSEAESERLYRNMKRDYYGMGTFHGKPSGCVMFELAHLMRKSNNNLLWLACVSLTDQFVHERLTDERYQAGVMELEQYINSLGNLNSVTTVTLQHGTKIKAPESSRISYEDEPRLMLLREWNLYDSMLCSSYIATKLKTWSDNGMKKLKLLLARMGLALVDCKQQFQYMSFDRKKKMKDEFERLLPEYGLTDFYYRSFLRLNGYSSKVSAADVVYAVTALLESYVNSDETCVSKQFGLAYDALASTNIDKLKIGMQQAINIQRAILRQGSAAIIKTGAIRSSRKFRWLQIVDPFDIKLLGYPQALTKFCYFLMDALKEKGARHKPLLCACLTQESNKVLIVGVCGKPRLGASKGNAFGIAFRTAAEEMRIGLFYDLFESSWIVINEDLVNKFVIRVTEKL